MRKLSCIWSLFLLIAISVAVSVSPAQKASAFAGGRGVSTFGSAAPQVGFRTSSADTTRPFLVSKNPTSTSVQAATTANISMTFNEDVRAVSGKFVRVCFSNGTTCSSIGERIPADDTSRISIAGATVTINPEMELNVNSTHYVRVDVGAFEDFSGNSFAGIISDGGSSFLTVLGVYTVSADGSAPVFKRACMSADRTTLHVLYDEQLVAGTLANGEFAVSVSGDAQSIQSVVVPNHAAHVTIRLVGAMSVGSSPQVSYSRHVSSGGIQDSNSNRSVNLALIDASSASDCAGPLMTASVPALGATGVLRNVNIVLEFDETVQMQYGKQILLRNNTTSTSIETFSTNDTSRVTVSGNTLIIDPTSDLPANSLISLHTIESGFVEDLSGNDFWGWGSTTFFTFTTGSTSDTVAPDATSTPDVVDGSDSGTSDTDNITSDATPTITVTAGESGGTVTVRAEKSGVFHTCQMSGSTSGSACTLPSLADGVWLITTVHADAIGNTSSRSAAQSITVDSVDPTVSWTAPSTPTSSLTFTYSLTFSEAVSGILASDFSSTGTATGCVFTPSAATANPSVSVSVTCTGNGSFVAQLKAGMVSDAAGNTGPASLLAASSVTVAADLIAPTASWTEPTTPSSSRTLSYTLTFSEAVSGIVTGDFGTIGTATGCVIATASGAANLSVVITVTCSSDGTVTLRLRSGSVLDAASNTGPTSDALATAVTITSPTVTTTSPAVTTTVASTTTVQPPGTTTTVATAPSGTGVTTTVPATATTVAVGQGSIATVTTVAGNKTASSTTVVATTASKGVGTADVTTTTNAPIVTTTTIAKLSAIDVPRTEVGGSSVLIGGKVVEGVVTRENNRLTITAGPMVVRIWAVAADGSKLALDADGRLRVKAGDSVTVDATGFSFNTRVEVRLYSDPVLLGRTDVDDKGVMNASYEIPEGIPSGNHNVVLAGERDGSPVTMALSVALGDQSSGNALAVVFIGVLIAAGVTALMLPAFLRRRRKEESGE